MSSASQKRPTCKLHFASCCLTTKFDRWPREQEAIASSPYLTPGWLRSENPACMRSRHERVPFLAQYTRVLARLQMSHYNKQPFNKPNANQTDTCRPLITGPGSNRLIQPDPEYFTKMQIYPPSNVREVSVFEPMAERRVRTSVKSQLMSCDN